MKVKSTDILVRKKGYFIFKPFRLNNTLAVFSTKPRDYKQLKKNRKWLCDLLGLDYKELVCFNQPHSSNIFIAKESNIRKPPISGFDGAISNRRKAPIAIFSADCLPIFFLDTKKGIVALVHAGWRGSLEKISKKTVGVLKKKFEVNPHEIVVGFGPCIRSCCYEVEDEFSRMFPVGVTRRKKDKYYFDLIQENKVQLIDSGIKRRNIFDSGFCTSCNNDLFFSYRREGKRCGRMMSLICPK